MTEVERGELDRDEEENKYRWVVCEPVWQVTASESAGEPGRQELLPGINEVAIWRAEREAAQRQQRRAE